MWCLSVKSVCTSQDLGDIQWEYIYRADKIFSLEIFNITHFISYPGFGYHSLCHWKQHGSGYPYPHRRYIQSWDIIWFNNFSWNGCTFFLGWSGSKTKWEWAEWQRSCFYFATIDISHSVLWWWWGYSICFLSTRLSDALASLALMVVTGSLTHWLIETGDWQFRMFDSSRTTPLVFILWE